MDQERLNELGQQLAKIQCELRGNCCRTEKWRILKSREIEVIEAILEEKKKL